MGTAWQYKDIPCTRPEYTGMFAGMLCCTAQTLPGCTRTLHAQSVSILACLVLRAAGLCTLPLTTPGRQDDTVESFQTLIEAAGVTP
jgi:hypothetical protein